jgi:hypothetical protein
MAEELETTRVRAGRVSLPSIGFEVRRVTTLPLKRENASCAGHSSRVESAADVRKHDRVERSSHAQLKEPEVRSYRPHHTDSESILLSKLTPSASSCHAFQNPSYVTSHKQHEVSMFPAAFF